MKIKIKSIEKFAYSKGLTIVELLISLAISSLLMAGMVTMVASNSAVFRENEQSAEASENLRYSLDVLSRHITMSGFMGNTQPVNVVATADLKDKTKTLFTGDVAPINGGGKYVNPAEFGNFVWYGNLKNTGLKKFASDDIEGLVIKQAISGALALDADERSNPNTSATPHRLYLLANPFSAKVYSSAAISKPTDDAVRQVSGNASTPLVMPVGSDIPGGRLYQYQTYIYTIEEDAVTNIRSLIQYTLDPVDLAATAFTFNAETLVENVNSFNLNFGVDTDGDSILNQYMSASDVTTSNHWDDIKSLTITVNANDSDGHEKSLGTAVVLRNLSIQQGAG